MRSPWSRARTVGAVCGLSVLLISPASASADAATTGDGWGAVHKVGRGLAELSTATANGDIATLVKRGGDLLVARKPYGEKWTRLEDFLSPSPGPGKIASTVGPAGWTYYWEEEEKESDSHGAAVMSRSMSIDGELGPIVKAFDEPAPVTSQLWAESTPGGATVVGGFYYDHGFAGMEFTVSLDGQTWSPLPPLPANISEPPNGGPALTVDDTGRVTYVSVEYEKDFSQHIVAATSNGDAAWTVTKIGPRPGYSVDAFYEADTGPAGDLVVTWEEADDTHGGYSLVAATHQVADPISVWDVHELNAQSTCYRTACNTVSIDGAGRATAVWIYNPDHDDEADVYVTRQGDDEWEAPQLLLSGVRDLFVDSVPRVHSAASGDVVFAYPSQDEGADVFQCEPDPTRPCTTAPPLQWPAYPDFDTNYMIPGPQGYLVAFHQLMPGDGSGSDHKLIQTRTLK